MYLLVPLWHTDCDILPSEDIKITASWICRLGTGRRDICKTVDWQEKENNNNTNNNKCLQSVCQFSAPSALHIQATDRLQFVSTIGIRYLALLLEYLLRQGVWKMLDSATWLPIHICLFSLLLFGDLWKEIVMWCFISCGCILMAKASILKMANWLQFSTLSLADTHHDLSLLSFKQCWFVVNRTSLQLRSV